MLISKKMNAAINEQIGHEFGASMQYLQIAAYFAGEGLSRLSAFFFKQSEEERDHAHRLGKYLVEAGAQLEIPVIPASKYQFKSAVDAVQSALDWEKEVTGQINALVELALKESDHLTYHVLGWFVKEQLEEVSSMDNLLKIVQRAGQNLLYVEQTISREKQAEAGEGS